MSTREGMSAKELRWHRKKLMYAKKDPKQCGGMPRPDAWRCPNRPWKCVKTGPGPAPRAWKCYGGTKPWPADTPWWVKTG